jgi:flagellar biosynthesis/type III secretory pathway M-ring protein FliF/YscJ
MTHDVISHPAGTATVLSAAVRIPRSYFVRKYRASNPTAAASTKEPDDNAIQPVFDQMLPRFQKAVQAAVGIKGEDAISIDMWDDFDSPLIGGGGVIASAGVGELGSAGAAGFSALLGGHVKELALGILAVVSLVMVSMIVKKGPQPVIAIEEAGQKEAPQLGPAEAIAGIVGGEMHTPLDGMELDEESVKAQQVVEQVATLVKEDPDAAATLVKRWLNRS